MRDARASFAAGLAVDSALMDCDELIFTLMILDCNRADPMV